MKTLSKKLSGHVDSVSFSETGKLAVGVSNLTSQYWNGQIYLMSAETLKFSKSVPTATGNSEICWIGDNVLAGTDSGCAYLWGFDKPEPLATFQEHDLEINSISSSPSSKSHFLTASSDTSIKLWDTNKISPVQSFTDHEAEVTGVRFSPSGGLFGSTSRDKTLKIWDQREAKSTMSIQHQTALLSLNWSANNNHIMFGGEDGSFQVVDIRNTSAAVFSKKYSSKVTAVSSSKNDKFVAVTTDSQLEVFSNADSSTPSSSTSSMLSSLLKDDSHYYLRSVSWNPTKPNDLVCGGWNKNISLYSIA